MNFFLANSSQNKKKLFKLIF